MSYETEKAELELHRLMIEELVFKSRSSFMPFIRLMMNQYIVNWHHRVLADRLTRLVMEEKDQRLMIFLPPRTGKSHQVSVGLPAWALGINPDLKVVGASYAAALACELNQQSQLYMEHPYYRKVFPGTKIPVIGQKNTSRKKRRQNLVEIIGRKGSYYSVGVGGSLTGKGADLLIIDDPYKDLKQAYSEVRRKFISDWYKAVGRTRLMPGANVIIMHTRWHEGDLAGELQELARTDSSATQWEVISLPMISGENRSPLDIRDKPGIELWPGYFSNDQGYIEALKKDVGSVVWNALYQQSPTTEGGNQLTEDDFRFYGPSFKLPLGQIEYTWDLDFGSDKKNSSYVVGQAWLNGIDDNFYLLDQFRKRVKFKGQLQGIQNMLTQFGQHNELNIENKANGPAMIQTLQGEIGANVIALNPVGSKEARFIAVTPLFEAGRVFLPEKDWKPWVSDYIKELCSFPVAPNDDQVDATSQLLAKWYDPFKSIDTSAALDMTGASRWVGIG
jgi:predicted phage terminase large subunit-like protein